MSLPVIEWKNSVAYLLDQTVLPEKIIYRKITTPRAMHAAIKRLVVRGAPAIGCAAAFGCLLGLPKNPQTPTKNLALAISKTADYLMTARPTAVNLFWAATRMKRIANKFLLLAPLNYRRRLQKEAQAILAEDAAQCALIGKHTLTIFPKKRGNAPLNILTHCNAGALATGGTGTALAGIYAAAKTRALHIYADETRPLLQGARLTAWELTQAKIPTTLICDNMVAQVMREGKIDLVIVGADRIAANGDTANKIGTFGVAILAKCFGLPFYVAAPSSTFDLTLHSGEQIPIEQRSSDEVRRIGDKFTAPKKVDVYNPAFDVTPAGLISAIITERGVIKNPTCRKIRTLIGN